MERQSASVIDLIIILSGVYGGNYNESTMISGADIQTALNSSQDRETLQRLGFEKFEYFIPYLSQCGNRSIEEWLTLLKSIDGQQIL